MTVVAIGQEPTPEERAYKNAMENPELLETLAGNYYYTTPAGDTTEWKDLPEHTRRKWTNRALRVLKTRAENSRQDVSGSFADRAIEFNEEYLDLCRKYGVCLEGVNSKGHSSSWIVEPFRFKDILGDSSTRNKLQSALTQALCRVFEEEDNDNN